MGLQWIVPFVPVSTLRMYCRADAAAWHLCHCSRAAARFKQRTASIRCSTQRSATYPPGVNTGCFQPLLPVSAFMLWSDENHSFSIGFLQAFKLTNTVAQASQSACHRAMACLHDWPCSTNLNSWSIPQWLLTAVIQLAHARPRCPHVLPTLMLCCSSNLVNIASWRLLLTWQPGHRLHSLLSCEARGMFAGPGTKLGVCSPGG